ncbi:cytochrome c biogenesis protein ResB [Sinosporangium siamense]|uniref:Cytochrome c biogenesis protein ResB n=1 Tax=Sinosporangium siamense TaxID=1367973 RepID=A0A919V8U1_9ACTN|nr:cytochrome c biogenesis protein ResB [Sinosporangium siamense]GII93587.1 cytochrome c biogenesis protein ResB [Sinosporangium siamense]
MAETTTDRKPGMTVKPPGGGGLGATGWLRWGWRTLTSMRTALVLLFLFAIGSIPGSLIPQRGVADDMVAKHFRDNPELSTWLDRLWLYDVFQAPWFAAIYLLLFLSLVGCVIPRTGVHLKELRRKPPAAPRNLGRLPHHASFTAATSVEEVASRLRKRRFRVATGPGWVAGEKGFLRESGNLLFHISLLGLLFAVGAGSLYGYRGNVLLVEGDGFSNTVAAYDRYLPGVQVSAESLSPFSFTLKEFQATYIVEGRQRGQALDFEADLRVTDEPGGPERDFKLKVNEPLDSGGTMTYLLGNGYAPSFTVTDGKGQVAFDGPVPCLTADKATFASECVIKVPDAEPEDLGFLIRFLPTSVKMKDGTYASAFPAQINPEVEVWAFSGDLGMDNGTPQSVYELNSDKLKPLLMQGKPVVGHGVAPKSVDAAPKAPAGEQAAPLQVGQSLDLPGGAGKITFTGVKEWVTLQTTYDPGRLPALIASVLAVAGLVLSLSIRRRRVWVRLTEAKEGDATVVEVGGLTRTEGGDAAFAGEFDDIVRALGARPAENAGDTDAHE